MRILSLLLIFSNSLFFINEIHHSILIVQLCLLIAAGFIYRFPYRKYLSWGLLPLLFYFVHKIYPQYRDLDFILSSIVLLSGLKTFELDSALDSFHLFLISCLMLAGILILKPSFLVLVYCIFVVLLTFYLVLKNNKIQIQKLSLKRIFLFILPALPLTFVLFFIFPRMGSGFDQGNLLIMSGFNEEINFSELGPINLSNDLVFQFKPDKTQEIPPEQRYFRGKVLWDTDGVKWFSRNYSEENKQVLIASEPLSYQVVLAQNQIQSLFGLEKTYLINHPMARINSDFSISTRNTKNTKLIYEATADLKSKDVFINDTIKRRSLKIKNLKTDALKQLLNQIYANKAINTSQKIAELKDYFLKSGFTYTLTPPLYQDVYDFLKLKQGYCSHYSTFLTILLRLSGIPARVINGYQGGELNPLSGYYQVYQKDAHSWVEYFDENQGWQKLDPTEWIVPDRIRLGINQLLNPDSIEIAGLNLNNSSLLARAFLSLSNSLSYLNLNLSIFFYDFDTQRQIEYLKKFKLPTEQLKFVTLVLFFILFFFIWWLYHYWIHQTQNTKIDRAYLRFIKKMKRNGLIKETWEGPLHFQQRCLIHAPEKEDEINEFFYWFLKEKYN
jgi:hypothetical protein